MEYTIFASSGEQKEFSVILSIFDLQEWMSSSPDENLHLPVPNVFIPTDLSLKISKEKVWCTIHSELILFSF